MVEWKEILLRQARLHRMCLENRDALAKLCSTKEQAIELYKKTINWALEEEYPPLDILRSEFSNYEKEGLFVDKHFDGELLYDHLCYVFHHCTGTIYVDINYGEKLIPMLYFANDCDITVLRKSDGYPIRVPIYTFGHNRVNAVSTDSIIFKHYDYEVKGGTKQ